MDKDEALKVILSDIKQAKDAKSEINSKIEKWVDEYNGESYGNEQAGKSKIVLKDIKKSVESALPNFIGPFVDKSRIIKLEGITAEDVEPSKMHERLLNYQFVRKFNRYDFIHDLFKVGATEGTSVIRVGWNLVEEEEVEEVEGVNYAFLQALAAQDIEYKIKKNKEEEEDEEFELDETGEELYDISIIRVKTIENHPTAEVVRNENFYPDPSVDRTEDMTFAAYKYETTLSELRRSGKYSEEDLDELILNLEEDKEGLEITRNTKLAEYGRSLNYVSEAEANKKVVVYEYYGYLDLNGDGVSEPIMATLVNNQLLEILDSPMPDGEIPFIVIPFSKMPFSIWGYPIAELISDNQRVRTSLMRGFIDNVAQSNNGKKFVRKNALDAVNKRKYEQNLGGLIEFNQDPGFIDGGFNALPPSIFNLYELVAQEAEGLSGINRTTMGLDSGALSSATEASINMDMGQKRMKDIVRRYAEGIKILLRKWISMNKIYLSDEEVMRINGNQFIPFTRDDISGEFDIEITVGVSGVSETRVNQMSMLMQQVGQMSAAVPPGFTNLILAAMADEWGLPQISLMLEEAVNQGPSQEEIQAQQQAQAMEMEKMMAEIEALKSKAELNKAKSFDTMSGANSKNVDNKMKAAGIVNKKNL